MSPTFTPAARRRPAAADGPRPGLDGVAAAGPQRRAAAAGARDPGDRAGRRRDRARGRSASTSATPRSTCSRPGVLALAVMSTAFTSLAIATGFERRYGVLKRLGASPLPRSGLLLGKVGALLLVEVAQVVVIGAVGAGARLGARTAAGPAGRGRRRARRHLRLRLARPARWPGRCAPRRRWPPPTWSTCCCSPAAPWCSRPRRTAGSATLVRWLPSGALGEAMRQADSRTGRSPSPALLVLLAWGALGTVLTARTFRWE